MQPFPWVPTSLALRQGEEGSTRENGGTEVLKEMETQLRHCPLLEQSLLPLTPEQEVAAPAGTPQGSRAWCQQEPTALVLPGDELLTAASPQPQCSPLVLFWGSTSQLLLFDLHMQRGAYSPLPGPGRPLWDPQL